MATSAPPHEPPPPASRANRHKSTGGLQRILRAAGYSAHGFRDAWRCESSFRQETILAALLTPVAILLPLPLVLTGLVLGAMLLVLLVELLNSALEWTVDYISPDDSPLAKRAKDMGSAAVSLALAHSALWWVIAAVEVWR